MKQIFNSKTVRRIVCVTAVLLLSALLTVLFPGGGTPAAADTQQRLDYLASLGWQADADSEQRQEIILPRQFGDVMADYAALQSQQGFTLERYAGREVSLFSYEVTNWPDKNLTVIADLYVYKNSVIAGDIHSTALDGFMIGLK